MDGRKKFLAYAFTTVLGYLQRITYKLLIAAKMVEYSSLFSTYSLENIK